MLGKRGTWRDFQLGMPWEAWVASKEGQGTWQGREAHRERD